MMKRIVLLSVLLVIVLTLRAQVLHITGQVSREMRTTDGRLQRLPVSTAVYIFDNYQEAQRQAGEYVRETRRQGGYVTIRSNDMVKPDYEGHFEADVSQSGALLVIDESRPYVTRITDQLQYDIVLKSSASDGILLDNTDVYGKRRGVVVRELPPVDDGLNLHWNVTIGIPAEYGSKDSRLIFQPMVMDCQTEEVVQFLEPMVFEGKRYRQAQLRRKSFDRVRNDSLAPYLQTTPLTVAPLSFQWEAAFPKPDPSRTYKWTSIMQLEDYTHVYYSDDSKEGTCNSRKPWKLLDVDFSRKEIQLDERYYEPAKAQLREADRDLQLTFEIGTARLTEDSANHVIIEHLIYELGSYGRQLMNVQIQGTASPDGSLERNTALAKERAQYALDVLRPYVGTASLQVAQPKVYTWQDVADSLEARGLTLEAEELRALVRSHATEGLRRMMGDTPAVGEILQNLRLMKCSYTIRQNKAMDAREALWAYRHDPSYAEGGDSRFSNGDYYHLFRQITDSAELRRLTERAYRELSVRPQSKYSPFAAYVANRMACYAIASDSVNTDILAPFVDPAAGLESQRQISFNNEYLYTVNRRELVANQAVMYFKAMKLGTASHLASKLPDTDAYRDIKMFADLETLFFKQPKTAAEQQRAEQALSYALNSSATNRAVLTFELAPELGKSYEEAEPLIDALPEDSPKRWYMKAVIAANRQSAASDNLSELAARYGIEKALEMQENATPDFLAYLQHCLDLNATYYRKYYVTDANVSDELRKKYPYDAAKAAVYRAKFEQLRRAAGHPETEENHETE